MSIQYITITDNQDKDQVITQLKNNNHDKKIHVLPESISLNPSQSPYQHLCDLLKKKSVLSILSRYDFTDKLMHTPAYQLSQGQAKMLGIILALHTPCDILLLINPYASLSINRIAIIKQALENLQISIYILTYQQTPLSFPSQSKKTSQNQLLSLKNFSVLRQKQYLHDLSLTIYQGEILGLMGDNGAGKSSLALGLMGYLPTKGQLNFERSSPPAIALLHQTDNFNPLAPLRIIYDEAFDQACFQKYLALFNVPTDFATYYPHELSTIQLRSIAISRLIARKPQLIILDEPFSGMPSDWIKKLFSLLHTSPITYLIIDHQHHYLKACCHRILSLNKAGSHAH